MRTKLGDDVDAHLARLADAGIRASTVVAPRFDLSAPESWDTTRAEHRRLVDGVAAYGGWSVS